MRNNHTPPVADRLTETLQQSLQQGDFVLSS